MKIKVTRKQYNIILNVYRLCTFMSVLILLVLYSILINKVFEFAIMFLTYFITKSLYDEQYHTSSMKLCFILSLFIFLISLTLCLPKTLSVIMSGLFGVVIAYASCLVGKVKHKLGDYDNLIKEINTPKKFNVNGCTLDELLDRCRELSLKSNQVEFCVDAFVNRLTIQELADKYCLEIQSVKNKKQTYKNKLMKY